MAWLDLLLECILFTRWHRTYITAVSYNYLHWVTADDDDDVPPQYKAHSYNQDKWQNVTVHINTPLNALFLTFFSPDRAYMAPWGTYIRGMYAFFLNSNGVEVVVIRKDNAWHSHKDNLYLKFRLSSSCPNSLAPLIWLK